MHSVNLLQASSHLEWWGAGVVVCLEQGADLHMAQLMPLPLLSLASVKSRLVLPFWYRLTWVVPEKEPLNVCVCVCVCVCVDVAPKSLWGPDLQNILQQSYDIL